MLTGQKAPRAVSSLWEATSSTVAAHGEPTFEPELEATRATQDSEAFDSYPDHLKLMNSGLSAKVCKRRIRALPE